MTFSDILVLRRCEFMVLYDIWHGSGYLYSSRIWHGSGFWSFAVLPKFNPQLNKSVLTDLVWYDRVIELEE